MIKTPGQMLAEHDKLVATEVRYTVVCEACGQDWQPLIKSSLWWRAKKKADKGFLDALYVSGKDCGCVKQPYKPDAPFRVYGYGWDCIHYDIPCDTFIEAVRLYYQCERDGDVVNITGVSEAVKEKIRCG